MTYCEISIQKVMEMLNSSVRWEEIPTIIMFRESIFIEPHRNFKFTIKFYVNGRIKQQIQFNNLVLYILHSQGEAMLLFIGFTLKRV